MKVQKPFFFVYALLILAILPCSAHSQENKSASNLHSLWKVEGASNTVYLLGSIHLLKQEDYPLSPALEAAYTNSQVVAFETDIGAMDEPATQVKMLGKVQLPAGETLEGQLTPSTYLALSNQVVQTGLPMMMFTQMQPFMVAMTVELMELQKLEVDPELGVDKHFYARAVKEGKRVVPLETVDFQIGLMTTFTREESEYLVKSTLDEMETTSKEFKRMTSAWKTGDSSTLAKLLNEGSEQYPVIFKRLVTNRNQNWIPKIQELLTGDKNAVVIVGVGHLVGSEGVVELLKKKGLKVTQL